VAGRGGGESAGPVSKGRILGSSGARVWGFPGSAVAGGARAGGTWGEPANQPTSVHRSDRLKLQDAFITAACRCAPPGNKPLPEELTNCRPFLLRELKLLTKLRVILGLGKIGFDTAFDALRSLGRTDLKPRPKFAHGAEVQVGENLTLLGTFHPSQQNTFTGKLTEPMFDSIFARIRILVD